MISRTRRYSWLSCFSQLRVAIDLNLGSPASLAFFSLVDLRAAHSVKKIVSLAGDREKARLGVRSSVQLERKTFQQFLLRLPPRHVFFVPVCERRTS